MPTREAATPTSNFNPKTGKRRKKGERTRICKKCGQPGHMQKTCPN